MLNVFHAYYVFIIIVAVVVALAVAVAVAVVVTFVDVDIDGMIRSENTNFNFYSNKLQTIASTCCLRVLFKLLFKPTKQLKCQRPL